MFRVCRVKLAQQGVTGRGGKRSRRANWFIDHYITGIIRDAVIQCRSVNTPKRTRTCIHCSRVHASRVSVHVRPCSRMLFVIIYEEPRGHEGEYAADAPRSGQTESLTYRLQALLSQRHNIVTDSRECLSFHVPRTRANRILGSNQPWNLSRFSEPSSAFNSALRKMADFLRCSVKECCSRETNRPPGAPLAKERFD